MSFREKYYKYKNKYLNLKNMTGGAAAGGGGGGGAAAGGELAPAAGAGAGLAPAGGGGGELARAGLAPAGDSVARADDDDLQKTKQLSIITHQIRQMIEGLPVEGEGPPVYVYFGHGRNNLIRNPDKPDEYMIDIGHYIPKSCIYLTFTKAGDMNSFNQMFDFISYINNENTKKLLLDPIKNLTAIAKKVKKSRLDRYEAFGGTLHIKKPGYHYTEGKFIPLMSYQHPDDGRWRIYRSGIYDITKKQDPVLPTIRDVIILNSRHEITLKQVAEIYKDSVFPTFMQVETIMQRNKITPLPYVYDDLKIAINELKTSSIKELFKRFPGIHYNPTCRVIDRTKPNSTLGLQQEASGQLFKIDEDESNRMNRVGRTVRAGGGMPSAQSGLQVTKLPLSGLAPEAPGA
jgi:hypothetical protein